MGRGVNKTMYIKSTHNGKERKGILFKGNWKNTLKVKKGDTYYNVFLIEDNKGRVLQHVKNVGLSIFYCSIKKGKKIYLGLAPTYNDFSNIKGELTKEIGIKENILDDFLCVFPNVTYIVKKDQINGYCLNETYSRILYFPNMESIEDENLSNFKKVEIIILPKVTALWSDCCCNCDNLKCIYIPNATNTYKAYIFYRSPNLETLVINEKFDMSELPIGKDDGIPDNCKIYNQDQTKIYNKNTRKWQYI